MKHSFANPAITNNHRIVFYYEGTFTTDSNKEFHETLSSASVSEWGLKEVADLKKAQIMDKLRCFAMNLMRWSKTGTQNFQASSEKFMDSPESLISMLEQSNFL